MALKKYEETDVSAIASAIREKTGGDKTYKVSQMDEGVNEVYEAGKKAEHDAFWDAYQGNGALMSYDGAFAGTRWAAETFKPKYDIKCNRAQSMFWNTSRLNIDLVEHLSKLGLTLDTSSCATFNQTFTYSSIKRVGVIDARNAKGNLQDTFSNSKIVTIDKFIVSESNTKYSNTFKGCTLLENVTFEGVIVSDIDFKDCTKLTKASIDNIYAHLKPDTEFTVTFSKTAVNNAYTTDEWEELVSRLPYITFSLI